MKRLLALFLLLASWAPAQEREAISFHLLKDPASPMRAWMLESSEEGMRIEFLGGGRKSFVRWDELVEEDRSALRLRFKLDRTRDEIEGLIPGHEIFFKGGVSKRGVLIEEDGEGGKVVLRADGIIFQYPKDQVDRIDQVKVKETEVYDEQQLYIRRFEGTPPRDAKEHADLAAYSYDIGNYRKAYDHYQEAIALDPSRRDPLEGRLAEIKDLLEDEEALAVFGKARYEALYNGRWAKASRMIDEYVASHPGALRRGVRLQDDLRVRRVEKLKETFHRAKADSLDRSIRKYIATKQPTLQEAMSWITSQATEQIESGVKSMLGLTQEEWELVRASKPSGAPHWATYWSGSFVLDPRAAKGKSSKNSVKGDPDGWWSQYGDTNTRATWLKAFAAEKLPLFEVVQVRKTACEKCGGTGKVKKSSVTGLDALNGAHEWMETCDRCFGAREDRSVAYR